MDKVPTTTTAPLSPSIIKKYIPVRNHLPTPIPSPTCSGMFSSCTHDT